jgi:ribosomal protein S18 acetylase RimI-like enzyme
MRRETNNPITEAAHTDVPKLVPILESAYQRIYGANLDAQLLASTPRENVLQSLLSARYQTTHVARCGDELLGFLSFGPSIIPGVGYTRRTVELSILAIRPECHRQGVGSALFQSMLDELQTRPLVQSLILWVESDNTSARRFYEKMGMTKAGVRQINRNLMRSDQGASYSETKYKMELGKV